MRTVTIGQSDLRGSCLAYGCWRLAGSWDPGEVTADLEKAGRRAVHAAVEAGFTIFDHADIYCQGACERLFSQVLRETPGLRDRICIVTKCGIRRPGDPAGAPYRYDFSREYIERSCEGSLDRLGIEMIDLFLLHRPDYLMDPEEVAAAFDRLRRAGKVRSFGVSNFSPSRVSLLQRACGFPLVAHQLELSLAQTSALEDGRLDQCLAERITPMAWSPLAGGKLGGGARRVLASQEAYQTDLINHELDEIAAARGTTRTVVALAWLLRHPARVIPVVGTTDPARIAEAALADGIELSREEWYRLLVTARGTPLP
jgi:predicted oxidoreductase